MTYIITHLFKNKIGDAYCFDISFVARDYSSSAIVGYIVINWKTWEYSLNSAKDIEYLEDFLEELKEKIISLESVIS